ncbi:hypothetical protein TSL6_14880 [Sulfurovum sp. TSL6]|uniref:GGDEF domain-containing protein n=1 Tax=Sulfurovum sp. TSL6 TaxID=2826995 RepID=UPI001CC6B72B|nr:GGDEF domain-containing protein [Sulfurovum sp. TSL6]GIU00982.1 hypothetical protein TSL6_14880 [Sulfurovum sp. TSL6]
MKIQKEWSSFRLTLLLYAIIFIIPLTFYFVYTSFNTLDADTKAIRTAGWLEGAAMTLAIDPSDQNNQQMVKHIDDALHKLSAWVIQNNDSEFYIGGQTLVKDLSNVTNDWNVYKQALSNHDIGTNIKENSLKWDDSVRNLTIIIENMIYLKQNKLINMFYWNLAAAMLFALLLIYLVRAYIHQQMKKHAIHDHDTKLFNKKYFCAELKTSCARAARNNAPLSLLSIAIDDLGDESKHYSQKMQAYILKTFGGLITSLTRESDVACRYDENHFSILLPDTSEENALVLEKRVREALEKHDFGVVPELNFKFATAHLNFKESAEAFRTRTEGLLK